VDIRLIKIDDGKVELVGDQMDVPLTSFEAAIQRIVLCLLNTRGTKMDAPGWGASAMKLVNMKHDDQSYVDVISNVSSNILPKEDRSDPFGIEEIHLLSVERGRARIRVRFFNSVSNTVSLPNVTT
jgi:hypothetical protein